MKKLLFTLSLLASFATFAEENSIDAGEQIFGVLPVTASTKSVIVSVPWVASGYDTDAAISVSNLIRTANLTVGDKVRSWDNDKKAFNVWTLAQDPSTSVKYWAGVTVIGTNGQATTESADVTTLPRGGALILTRNDDYTAGTEYTFYVCGQYTSSGKGSTTCVAGTASAPAYTLIAPPNVTATAVNSITWSGVASTDAIQLSGTVTLGYKNSSWGTSKSVKSVDEKTKKISFSKEWTSDYTIPAGQGVWYVSRGESAATATW